MGTKDKTSNDFLPGTLEMLVMKTLTRGPLHGYGIALYLQQTSEDVLQVGEGSLYPALQRLLINGWVEAEWGVTETKRKARFYRLTPEGREQLALQQASFDRLLAGIARVMQTA